MRLLLDTQIVVWMSVNDRRLSDKARTLIEAAAEVHVSIVSVWEVAIKSSLPAERSSHLDVSAGELMRDMEEAEIDMLALAPDHIRAFEKLPFHHRDPYDRLLVAQALHEPMRLMTSDAMLARYGEMVILV